MISLLGKKSLLIGGSPIIVSGRKGRQVDLVAVSGFLASHDARRVTGRKINAVGGSHL